jgi:hypothetical protein
MDNSTAFIHGFQKWQWIALFVTDISLPDRSYARAWSPLPAQPDGMEKR